MPFRPFIRWKLERTPRPALLSQEVDRLSADPRIHRVFEWFNRHEREIADFQLAITAVAAPPFAEHVRAAWLCERLQSQGLSATLDAVGNLLAPRPGLNSDSPPIAVSAHLDTVFPASTPLAVYRENAQLFGPGISDNASGLSALWALAAAFHEVGIRTTTPLLFVANVGEEGEGNLRGMRHLYRGRLSAQPAIEDGPAPTLAMLIAIDGAGSDTVICQALGSRRYEIAIEGPGGHSWSDFGTPNPIVAASLLVSALFNISLPLNPRTTLNVGAIEGGTSINTIPERAVVRVDVRSSDPKRLDELEQQLRRSAAVACAETQARSAHSRTQLTHTVTLVGERPAGELPEVSPLLAAIRAVDAQLGIKSQVMRASTDANIPLSLGLDAVTLGAGGTGGGAHTIHEWYDPAGREQALRRLTLLVLILAGIPDPSVSDEQSETTSSSRDADPAASDPQEFA